MTLGRRTFLQSLGAFGASLAQAQLGFSQTQPIRQLPRPDPSLFQAGDFVWPKKPGAYIPYNSGSRNGPAQDRDQWLGERDAYIRRFESQAPSDPLLQQRIKILRRMEYREFMAVYEGAQELGVPGAYSGGTVYVGHVGLIEIDDNKMPWVVEALLERGVVRKTYADWITERAEEVVWLGRLRELDQEQRGKIIIEAKKYLGKPYDFWDFDLNDDSGFYCSKLAWLAIYRTLGFAIDGQSDPKRLLWFSPKQFLYLPTIVRIHDPGPYATK